jgi:cobyric acid synthase
MAKVVLMQKQVGFQVLGRTIHEAAYQVQRVPEFEGFTILSTKLDLINNPGAVSKTLDFVEQSGTEIPGYSANAREIEGLQLWSASVVLEYSIEAPPAKE